MSDDEGSKKSGYRLEYANSARAKCKGPKPCSGTTIGKGELRFGSLVDFRGNTSFAWRHWGCVTSKILDNMKKTFDEADELDGFDDLEAADQEKIRKAWEEGRVADEDIPETARKPAKDDDGEDEEEEDAKPTKKKVAAPKATKKAAAPDESGVFKLDYASSSRSKCKGGCDESIGKDFLRLGREVDFRGNKSFSYQHWGCASSDLFAKLKKAYSEPTDVEGFKELQDTDKERVERAWEKGEIPEGDQGAGEPTVLPKKAPAKRAKKDDGEPPKKRVRKAKKEEDDEEDEEEEKPKPKAKSAPAKKASEKKAPAKKRAPKKKVEDEDEDSGEDFRDAIDAISGHEDEDEEEKASTKKRKRAPPTKPTKATSKKAAPKPSSSRRKKQDSDDE